MRQLCAALCLLAAACTSAAPDPDAGPLESVATATSGHGMYQVDLLGHASVTTRGNHDVQLVITDPTGAAVDDLDLTVVPWMPAMGHGTSITPVVTPMGDGTYAIDRVDLFMPGLWELRTTFHQPDDYAAPSLQVQ